MATTPKHPYKPPKFMYEFWPHLEHQAVWLVIVIQVAVMAGLAVLLIMLGVLPMFSPILWLFVVAVGTLGTAGQLWVIHILTQPGKDIFAAIISVSGERTVTTPPNPNDDRFANTGFKEALKAVYSLAARQPVPVVADAKNTPVLHALDETPCGFVVMNHARQIIYSNTAAPTTTNAEGHQSLAVIWNSTDTLDAWLDDCDNAAIHETHTWRRIADKLPGEDGRRLFDVIASYNQGSDSEVVVALVDRTDTYEAGEQDLDFIAFAAHELRGPITVIRGYLEVLQNELDGVLQNDQHELFRRLTVSANRLSGYVNNILNTSRYDRRHLKVHLSEDSYATIYDTIADDMQLRATSQGRTLSVAIKKDLPTIAADRNSLSEVMANLIDNAIKYSNEGGNVKVTAEVKGDFVELAVTDHGIGMPSSVVGNLFQKFYRSHRSRETVAGTGIGLYISKAIVESHGGTIYVQSVDGEGSTFFVDIPIYSTVADKLKSGDNNNETLISSSDTTITNHSMYRG